MRQQLKRKLAGRRRASRTAAQGLGWFSIGLGIAEVLMPRMMARALGVPDGAGIMRAYGLREIATGVGILTAKDPTPWVWGRVAGDALDLASLGGAFAKSDQKACVAGAIGAVAGVTLADIATGKILSEIREKDRTEYRDYSDRSGFPRSVNRVRAGAAPSARGDLQHGTEQFSR
jgi:hypothetical protein